MEVTFYDFHKPVLEDGQYTVTLQQTVTAIDNSTSPATTVNQTYNNQSLEFHVSGPRFALDPSLIYSVYPPVGGKGDYMADLPSLVLNRSTLPWERSPVNTEIETNSASWLFLLLIDETETSKVIENNNANLSDLSSYFASESTNAPPLTSDDLSRLPSQINYLEVDPSLSFIIPASLNELQYLSYTRIKSANPDIPQDSPEEKAVLLCNRLPQRGHNSTVYLISVENNYNGTNDTFSGIKKQNGNLIFPYMYKWQFHAFDDQLYCITQTLAASINQTLDKQTPPVTSIDFSSIYDNVYVNKDDFEAALAGLNITDGNTVSVIATAAKFKYLLTQEIADKFPNIQGLSTLIGQTWGNKTDFTASLNNINLTDAPTILYIENLAKLPGSTFHSLLSNLQGGFSPFSINPAAGDITETGTVKLPYNKISQGNGTKPVYTTAWYRGPLAGGKIDLSTIDANFPQTTVQKTNGTQIVPPENSADLVLNDLVNKIEDTTYASAYELGRLIALDDVDFSTEFYKWKNETAMALRLQQLGATGNYPIIPHLPLSDNPQINPIPQHVIDKFTSWKNLQNIPFRYLVPEVDLLPNESIRFFQVDNNWVNAFICGAFSIGHTVEADLSSYLSGLLLTGQITGFLINSLVVSGWPDFEVDAIPVANGNLSLLRKDNLDVNIRLYLLSGTFTQLKFHLHPGKMHSGFLYEDDKYTKDGGTIDFTNDITNNVISISSILKSTLLNATQLTDLPNPPAIPVANFAAKMIEGTPTVVFIISAGS